MAKRRKNKKKSSTKPPRNFLAVVAWFRNSAGAIKDKKKEKSRKACRGKIKDES